MNAVLFSRGQREQMRKVREYQPADNRAAAVPREPSKCSPRQHMATDTNDVYYARQRHLDRLAGGLRSADFTIHVPLTDTSLQRSQRNAGRRVIVGLLLSGN